MSSHVTTGAESVLLICPGDPTGSRTGRISVLETAVVCLTALDAEVTVVALTSQEGPDTWLDRPLIRVDPPRRGELALSAARAVIQGRTLNEAVMDSARVRRQVREVATSHRAVVVVASGMRVWPVAESLGVPVICHLDDLLSARYTSPAFLEGNDSVLGYYGSEIPAPARQPAEWAARRVLRWEGRRAYRRESDIATRAGATAMTSATEASVLASRVERPIHALPMAVDAREPADVEGAPAWSAVFLGVLHYGPNVAALRFVRDEVFPILREQGVTPHLTVIGSCDSSHREEFEAAGFTMAGYVDDLGEALRGHRMFLSPVLSGAGVKTKVLDGMSVGLPVVATPCGLAGIPASPGHEALLAEDANAFADAMRELAESPARAAAIGRAGRDLLISKMSTATTIGRWASVLNLTKEAQ